MGIFFLMLCAFCTTLNNYNSVIVNHRSGVRRGGNFWVPLFPINNFCLRKFEVLTRHNVIENWLFLLSVMIDIVAFLQCLKKMSKSVILNHGSRVRRDGNFWVPLFLNNNFCLILFKALTQQSIIENWLFLLWVMFDIVALLKCLETMS